MMMAVCIATSVSGLHRLERLGAPRTRRPGKPPGSVRGADPRPARHMPRRQVQRGSLVPLPPVRPLLLDLRVELDEFLLQLLQPGRLLGAPFHLLPRIGP